MLDSFKLTYLLHTVPIRHVTDITLVLDYLILIQIFVDRHFARLGRFEQPMYITGDVEL